MSLLEVKDISFSYGKDPLFKDASLRLFEGEHAVLVGPNGCGKSTLMKMMGKELSPDRGTIEWVNYRTFGYLDQYAKIDPKVDVKTYLYDVFLPLFEKEREIHRLYESIEYVSESQYEGILNKAHQLEEALAKENFYAMSSTISNVMNGLGLDTALLDQKIGHLSGGMRAKLILGKLLLQDVDILLLDEPTNFLDTIHIEWLIKYLNSTPKTFIVISHDEYFLRSIAQTVFAIEYQKVNRYKGNYDFYLNERSLRFEHQQKAFFNQQKFIEKTEDYIRRNIARESTTKMAQSRRKMLAKLPKISKPIENRKLKIDFKLGPPTGRDVLHVDRLEIGYDHVLVEPISFKIVKGDKVAITGKNGIGKSTLIKTIIEEIPRLGGSFQLIESALILYFEQDILLEEKLTPFEIIHDAYPKYDRKEIMQILASFGISFEMAHRPLKTLSGGEKTKVKFALTKDIKSNVILLDEPTNHLDKNAKDALKDALNAYLGTVILVSHDKSFYEEICDYEIHLSNG